MNTNNQKSNPNNNIENAIDIAVQNDINTTKDITNLSIGMHFLNIELLRRKLIRPYFIELGLTVGQGFPRILKTLRTLNRPVTQKELADICILDVTTMSRALDKLEQSGLLKRSTNPQCRRSWLISLTEEGNSLADKVIEIFNMTDEIFINNLSETEIATLIALLNKIENNLNNAIDEHNPDNVN